MLLKQLGVTDLLATHELLNRLLSKVMTLSTYIRYRFRWFVSYLPPANLGTPDDVFGQVKNPRLGAGVNPVKPGSYAPFSVSTEFSHVMRSN